MKTITVQVSIQMDIQEGEQLSQVKDILEHVNEIIIGRGIPNEPQICISDISNADIFENEPE